MLSARQQHCLQGIGITRWQTRSSFEVLLDERVCKQDKPLQTPTQPVTQPQPSAGTPALASPDLTSWAKTLQSIDSCSECELAQSCSQKVPGKGFPQAELLIIGEAPGHEEDIQGLPFVGRAGQLLDRMLLAIDIDPKNVYITNILKCRPPSNRDPKAEEVSACSRFLQAQIKLIKPRVIFSVGRISAQNLLHSQVPVGKLRGHKHSLPGTEIPLLVTYHPAYLLRNPAQKAKVWEDLKALKLLLKPA